MGLSSLPQTLQRCSLLSSKSQRQQSQHFFIGRERSPTGPLSRRYFSTEAKAVPDADSGDNSRKKGGSSRGKRSDGAQLWQGGQLPENTSARSRVVSAWLLGRRKTMDRKKSGRRGTVAEERPDLIAQWDEEENGLHTPHNTTAGSPFRAAWKCGRACVHCGTPHQGWTAAVVDRCKLQSTGCPFCSGLRVCLCQSLAAKRPDLMRQWDFKANSAWDPTALGCNSERRATWKCRKHGSWVTQIQVRTQEGGPGCPTCAQEGSVQPARRGLLKQELPALFVQLHPALNGHLGPLDALTCGSTKKAVWLCTAEEGRPLGCTHEHVWEARIDNRASSRSPKGCPFCSGHRVCPCNSLERRHPESALMQYWYFARNTDTVPSQTALNSSKKVWWRHCCPETGEEHVWEAQVRHVVRAWSKYEYLPCPKCDRRQERRPLIVRSTPAMAGASIG